MSYRYCQSLPSMPLDIIGGVHDELVAFQSLLYRLGHRDDGFRPYGWWLVLVGDLCDRGLDSPAMLVWFKRAYERGWAWMVSDNHELSILADDPKNGSGWLFDVRTKKDVHYASWHCVEEREKAELCAWLAKQPLLLEYEGLCIVHAAWLPPQIERLKEAKGESLTAQYRRFDAELKHRLQMTSWHPDYLYEQTHHAPQAENPDHVPPPMPATARYEFERSRLYPIHALTSGVECLVDKPSDAGGRWRGTTRCAWWDDYRGDTPVVIGHYWHSWQPSPAAIAVEQLLLPSQPDVWHGARRNVFCVDFSIGASWWVRKFPQKYRPEQFRLAVSRWPEKVLVFDSGECAVTCQMRMWTDKRPSEETF